MKRSFVYLIAVLLMAAMLSGCGSGTVDNSGINTSPTHTVLPSIMPYAGVSAAPSTAPTGEAGGVNTAVPETSAGVDNGGTAASGAPAESPAQSAGAGA